MDYKINTELAPNFPDVGGVLKSDDTNFKVTLWVILLVVLILLAVFFFYKKDKNSEKK